MGHVFISRRLRFHMTSAWAWDTDSGRLHFSSSKMNEKQDVTVSSVALFLSDSSPSRQFREIRSVGMRRSATIDK